MANLGSSAVSRQFWQGKRVLITGHTGFKGSWLSFWLTQLGANVTGISLAPHTTPSLFTALAIDSLCDSHFCDIRHEQQLNSLINTANPDVVFHLAAQPLVRASYQQPVNTFATNIMGTVNTLQALRGLNNLQVAVMITTDKVYKNNEWLWPYRETDSLGGYDPYSASKAACEIVIDSYRQAFLNEQGIAIASARAGNVIGGGDWSEDRLIPDSIRAWQAGENVHIRRPQATRPWQHVLEPLAGYLTLAEKLWQQPALSGAYNFGPEPQAAADVKTVVNVASQHYPKASVSFGDGNEGPHEAQLLALDTTKARTNLNISPRWSVSEAVEKTIRWYRLFDEGSSATSLCLKDIASFGDTP